MRSFAQSLTPLQNLIQQAEQSSITQPQQLSAKSTDELGVLTTGYKQLLNELNVHNEILMLSNSLLLAQATQANYPKFLRVSSDYAKRPLVSIRFF